MTDCHWVLTGHTAWTTEWYASAFDVTNRWLNHALSMSGRKRKEETACKCGSTTHKRTRSRHCHLNTRWVDEHLRLGDQVAANRELSRLESLRQALTGTGDAVSAVVPPASSPPASSPPAIVALLADEVHLLHSLRLPATGVTTSSMQVDADGTDRGAGIPAGDTAVLSTPATTRTSRGPTSGSRRRRSHASRAAPRRPT